MIIQQGPEQLQLQRVLQQLLLLLLLLLLRRQRATSSRFFPSQPNKYLKSKLNTKRQLKYFARHKY